MRISPRRCTLSYSYHKLHHSKIQKFNNVRLVHDQNALPKECSSYTRNFQTIFTSISMQSDYAIEMGLQRLFCLLFQTNRSNISISIEVSLMEYKMTCQCPHKFISWVQLLHSLFIDDPLKFHTKITITVHLGFMQRSLRLRSCLFCEGRISVLKRWFKTPIQNAVNSGYCSSSSEPERRLYDVI